jgi:hypothetical protein
MSKKTEETKKSTNVITFNPIEGGRLTEVTHVIDQRLQVVKKKNGTYGFSTRPGSMELHFFNGRSADACWINHRREIGMFATIAGKERNPKSPICGVYAIIRHLNGDVDHAFAANIFPDVRYIRFNIKGQAYMPVNGVSPIKDCMLMFPERNRAIKYYQRFADSGEMVEYARGSSGAVDPTIAAVAVAAKGLFGLWTPDREIAVNKDGEEVPCDRNRVIIVGVEDGQYIREQANFSDVNRGRGRSRKPSQKKQRSVPADADTFEYPIDETDYATDEGVVIE